MTVVHERQAATREVVTPQTAAPVVQPPTRREQAIAALMAETGCKRWRAARAYDWLAYHIGRARRSNRKLVFLWWFDMLGSSYRIINQVMGHGARYPLPDTAHALLSASLLNGSRGERGLFHDETERGHCMFGVLHTVGIQDCCRG